jgi:hypothetical protein
MAFSGLCLLASLAVVVLWVRSYAHWDNVLGPIAEDRWLAMRSLNGTCIVGSGVGRVMRWEWRDFGRMQRDDLGFLGGGRTLEITKKREVLGIGIAEIAGGRHIFAPHWFVALSFAVLAATPWMRTPNRFSLRALFVAITLLAVGLGVAVYVWRS